MVLSTNAILAHLYGTEWQTSFFKSRSLEIRISQFLIQTFNVNQLINIWITVLLSAERFIAVCYPLKVMYKKILT